MTGTSTVLADSELYRIDRIRDGDTIDGTRLTLVGADDDDEVLTRDRFPRGMRLALVDTPERRTHPVEAAAAAEVLRAWLDARTGRLRVRTYGDGGFGRVLVDLYDADTGDTASGHLLAAGYPLYRR